MIISYYYLAIHYPQVLLLLQLSDWMIDRLVDWPTIQQSITKTSITLHVNKSKTVSTLKDLTGAKSIEQT